MKKGRNDGAYSKACWIFQPPLYQVRLYKENPIQPYPITIVDVLNTFVRFIFVNNSSPEFLIQNSSGGAVNPYDEIASSFILLRFEGHNCGPVAFSNDHTPITYWNVGLQTCLLRYLYEFSLLLNRQDQILRIDHPNTHQPNHRKSFEDVHWGVGDSALNILSESGSIIDFDFA